MATGLDHVVAPVPTGKIHPAHAVVPVPARIAIISASKTPASVIAMATRPAHVAALAVTGKTRLAPKGVRAWDLAVVNWSVN